MRLRALEMAARLAGGRLSRYCASVVARGFAREGVFVFAFDVFGFDVFRVEPGLARRFALRFTGLMVTRRERVARD